MLLDHAKHFLLHNGECVMAKNGHETAMSDSHFNGIGVHMKPNLVNSLPPNKLVILHC